MTMGLSYFALIRKLRTFYSIFTKYTFYGNHFAQLGLFIISVKIWKMDGKQMKFLKTGILIWLALQNSVHTVVLRYSRSRPINEMFLSSVAVFWMEIVKLIICLIVVVFEERSLKKCIGAVHQTVFLDPWDTLKVGVPSFLYTLQNNLFFLAASHLEAATFMVMSQLKIITTALFAVCLLKRSLSWIQWISLFLLFLGVSLVQLQENSTASKKNVHQSPLLGLAAVVAASTLSGFAGVYFEKILKKPVEISMWMRNVQLAMMSVPISGVTMFVKDGSFILCNGIFYGFDYFVWFVVFWYVFSAYCEMLRFSLDCPLMLSILYFVLFFRYGIGGLTVAACIKYADNIAKNFATSFAIIISTILSIYVFNFSPNYLFVCGASIVIASIFLYTNQSAANGATKSVVVVAKKLDTDQILSRNL